MAGDSIAASPWVKVTGRNFHIQAPYHDDISDTLRRIGAKCVKGVCEWRLPLSARDDLARELPEIHAAALWAMGEKKDAPRLERSPPRVFRQEFLVPQPKAPRHELVLASRGTQTME